MKANTRMIIINNPNNLTGSMIPKFVLSEQVDFAKEKGIIILSDEVYRPLFHSIPPINEPSWLINFGYDKPLSREVCRRFIHLPDSALDGSHAIVIKCART